MPAPSSTIWELEAHTRAKHEILSRYLQAWIPILSQGRFPEMLYIDGFAGPGRYSHGEDGSPIIALKAATNQRVKISAKVNFVFVEKDGPRADMLETLVDELERPSSFTTKVYKHEAFETAFQKIQQEFLSTRGSLPPTFAFIDPFGWAGVPFKAVIDILSYPSCEVFVNFMYEEINRFIGHQNQEENFDKFFGTPDWRNGIGLTDARARNRFFHDLYVRQLSVAAGAKYVRSFEMRNTSNVTDYFLFYATKNYRGLQKMKEAMWRVDEGGEFTFSDATDPNQPVLFGNNPRFDVLRKQITQKFSGKETTYADLEQFVVTETAFRETHIKRQILRPMELSDPQELVVFDAPSNRQRGTYSDPNTKLRFL